jgi:hypothetical protein
LTGQFVFRFQEYDGSESQSIGNQIDDSNVVEYEFINQGTTICIINEGLRIYPSYSGIEPSRVKLEIDQSEKDVTVYQFRFEDLDFFQGHAIIDNFIAPGTALVITGFVPAKDFINMPNQPAFNRLLVISKMIATVEDEN